MKSIFQTLSINIVDLNVWFVFQVLHIKQLNGYDDQNFHVTVDEKNYDNQNVEAVRPEGYVLKILNIEDSANQQDHIGSMCIRSTTATCCH